MAQPKKMTAHLELVGAFKKNPNRKRLSEPQCKEPIGKAPDWFSDDEVFAWDFLVDNAVAGVLTAMDRAYFVLVTRALASVWKDKVCISNMHKVGTMLGKMGMTPTERSGVVMPQKPEAGEYDNFKAT